MTTGRGANPGGELELTIADVVDRLVSLERETGLCERRIAGFYYWDALRMKFFYHVAERLGLYEKAQRYRRPRILEYFGYLGFDLRSFLGALHRFPAESRVLVLANARRKREGPDGLWTDIITDPVVERLEIPPIVLEARIGGVHPSPARTRNLYYYDLLRYVGGVLQPAIRLFARPTKRERAELREVEKAIEQAFGIRFPLERAALDALAWRKALVPLYSGLLRKSRAHTLILVCSYGKEAWIEACARCGVRTIELQHGTITRFHPGYHYPEGTTRHYAPDEFWAFGEYWTRTVRFPTRTRLRPGFGFPHLERVARDLREKRDDHTLLVISQGTIGRQLSRLVTDSLALLPLSMRIVYKLHPGEIFGWREAYPWLTERPDRIEVIEGDEPGLYHLMARARWQLGVNSTALFEGMRLGCRTVLADFPGIEYMEDVIASRQAVLIRSAAELPAALDACPVPDGHIFFDRDESMIAELDEAARR